MGRRDHASECVRRYLAYNQRRIPRFFDPSALTAAASLSYYYWTDEILRQQLFEYLCVLPLLDLFSVTRAAAELYPGFELGSVEGLRRLVNSVMLACRRRSVHRWL